MSGPEESPDRRLARNVNELLQEIRVAQAGVQILFGFLFSVTFTDVYQKATEFQRNVHLVAVLLAVIAVGLLTAPAAWHRVLFRQGRRETIIHVANRLALSGLGFLAATVSTTLLLLVDVVVGRWQAIVACALAAVVFGVLWFVLPLRVRRSDE
ncbi:DUF6328 family protein [Amycolatopsis nigrescens]|uniref:DUF6328 family protein n=1 Tax=Amycolatopsis nigrescens TaxID=381445 RepID=UPI0003A82871|nr:DUF6328 family protein [Amycolatopsis nigrescens]